MFILDALVGSFSCMGFSGDKNMYLEVIARKPETGHPRRVPLLCVHGGFHAAWCWDEYFLPYFAQQGFEAYALSLRGHGQSDGHERINRWHIADYVDDVENAIAELPAAPVLIGHSLGGIVVQKYLERRPAPAGVLLASSPLQGMAAASFRHFMNHPWPMLKMFFTFNMIHALPTFRTVFFSTEMPEEQVETYFTRMGNESFRALIELVLFDKPDPRLISTPMLVLGGEHDSSIPREVNESLASVYDAQCETLPVAHDMMLDANWESAASRGRGR